MDAREEIKNYLENLERYKAANQLRYDYYKHLTTLCLGAILFMAAFLPSKDINALQQLSVTVSVALFLTSIVIAVYTMTSIGDLVSHAMRLQVAGYMEDREQDERVRVCILVTTARIKFLANIVAITFPLGVAFIIVFLASALW